MTLTYTMYDYLPDATPDVDVTLSVDFHDRLTMRPVDSGFMRWTDGMVPVRGSFGSVGFELSAAWSVLAGADVDTLFELYFDSTKANGVVNTFKLSHPDGQTYVVHFNCRFPRRFGPVLVGVPDVVFRVVGRAA